MNTAISFLTRNWERLHLSRFGDPSTLACVVLTPRFRASAHVIFLIWIEGSQSPALVIKASRCSDLDAPAPLDQEASNLRAVHAAFAGGFDSIPRLLAYEEYAGTRLLLETALRGRTVKPALVRHHPNLCAEAILAWVTRFHAATALPDQRTSSSFDTLLAHPLADLEDRVRFDAGERRLATAALHLTGALREHRIPLVFTHGDLSAPNLLLSDSGDLEVVDWELAEAAGLPGEDLFFSLAYLAFARRRAQTLDDYIAAFQEAFFAPAAWTQPYVERYVEALQLPRAAIEPLFVACWTRYLIKLAARIIPPGVGPETRNATAAWLRHNRFFALWSYAVQHAAELRCHS